MKITIKQIKKIVLLLLWVPATLLLFTSLIENTEHRLDKKMNQVLKKIWKNNLITKTPFLFPPNLKPGESTEVFRLTSNEDLMGFMVLNKAYSCKVGGCSAWSPGGNQDNYEPFYYVVVVNPDLTINQIKIIEYYSEYGYEITSKRWLSQFTGKTGCNLAYNKQIDGISGATISVKSMIYDVNNTCKMMEKLAFLNLL